MSDCKSCSYYDTEDDRCTFFDCDIDNCEDELFCEDDERYEIIKPGE